MLKRVIATVALTAGLTACQPIHHWTEASPEVQAEHSSTEIQAFIDGYWRQVWVDVYWQRVVAYAEAVERARVVYPSGQCGGSLPPCWVMMRESGGNIRAENPRSSASGKWQFIDSTWAGYAGYRHASQAPEKIQDDKARLLWAGGRGCSHWSAC